MDLVYILAVALGLAADALAVSIAVGLRLSQITHRHVFRIAFHFGLFQCLMPMVGWLAGRTLEASLARYDHWVAFGLLAAVGARMLWGAFRQDAGAAAADPTRGWLLVTLSIATSIDALGVGLSMGLLQVSVWLPSIIIGVITGVLTTIGVRFGGQIGPPFGRAAEAVGGVILLAIGIRIVVAHAVSV